MMVLMMVMMGEGVGKLWRSWYLCIVKEKMNSEYLGENMKLYSNILLMQKKKKVKWKGLDVDYSSYAVK